MSIIERAIEHEQRSRQIRRPAPPRARPGTAKEEPQPAAIAPLDGGASDDAPEMPVDAALDTTPSPGPEDSGPGDTPSPADESALATEAPPADAASAERAQPVPPRQALELRSETAPVPAAETVQTVPGEVLPFAWPGTPTPDAHAGEQLDQAGRSSRRHIVIGLLIVIIGFGGLGTWAALAPLTSASIASGVVVPSGGRRNVQHLEGGIIKEVLVTEGQRVAEGDVLMRLEDTQARATADRLADRARGLQARSARLTAERNGASSITFPDELMADSGSPSVASILAAQQDLFTARRDAYQGQLSILKDRVRQLDNQIQGYEAQRKAAQEQLELIRDELGAARKLFEKGIYEKPKVLALERSAAGLRGSIGEYSAGIARSREAIGESESRAIDLQNQRLKEITTELDQVQASQLDTDQQLRAARDVLDRMEIRAPGSGTVVGLKHRTSGGVIAPRMDIMDIVPEGDTLIVEVQISPSDIDVVHPGLTAEVRFSAFNYRTTPLIVGTVIHVSADRFTDEKRGTAYYQGKVEVPAGELARLEGLSLQPGMPAEVHIVTGAHTPLEYLLKPMKDAIHRAWREE
jgi:HlyD family secretion protein/epimerase transport system membrane fusion protein